MYINFYGELWEKFYRSLRRLHAFLLMNSVLLCYHFADIRWFVLPRFDKRKLFLALFGVYWAEHNEVAVELIANHADTWRCRSQKFEKFMLGLLEEKIIMTMRAVRCQAWIIPRQHLFILSAGVTIANHKVLLIHHIHYPDYLTDIPVVLFISNIHSASHN